MILKCQVSSLARSSNTFKRVTPRDTPKSYTNTDPNGILAFTLLAIELRRCGTDLISALSVISFENRLDTYWAPQNIMYDWEAEFDRKLKPHRVTLT